MIILLNLCAAALAYNDIADINIDALVSDPVEIRNYLDCYIDKGPCTPVMAKIKGEVLVLRLIKNIKFQKLGFYF